MIPIEAYMSLIKIASIEGTTQVNGIEAREQALKEWLKSWIEEKTVSQSIIKSAVTLEEQEAVKYYLANLLSDMLVEDCVQLVDQPTKITAKIASFRRKNK